MKWKKNKPKKLINNIYSNIWTADSNLVQYDTVSLGERVPHVLKQYHQNISNFLLKNPTRL